MPNDKSTYKLVMGGLYQHFKGNKYIVVGTAKNTETEEEMVLYHEYSPEGLNEFTLWARPRDMFESEVDHDKYPDIKQRYRFELISENPMKVAEEANQSELSSFTDIKRRL